MLNDLNSFMNNHFSEYKSHLPFVIEENLSRQTTTKFLIKKTNFLQNYGYENFKNKVIHKNYLKFILKKLLFYLYYNFYSKVKI